MRNKFAFGLIITIAVTVLMLYPQLKMPWSLIDDAENLRMSQEIEQHLSSGDYSWLLGYEKVNGRFRPVYWIWHFLNFKIFGFSALGHHFSHLVLYILISVLIFLITNKISKSNFAGLLSVTFFLFFYPIAENFYRLGTAEPKIIFFYLFIVWRIISLYFNQFLFAKAKVGFWNYFLIFFILLLAYFTKETTPILIFAFFFLFLAGLIDSNIKDKRGWTKFFVVFIIFNVLCFVFFFVLRQAYYLDAKGDYIQAYGLDFLGIIRRLYAYTKLIVLNYNLTLLIPIISFGFTFKTLLPQFKKGLIYIANKQSSVFLWQIVLIVWFLLFFLIQIPWGYVMGRYLAPAIAWLAVFLGIEYGKYFSKDTDFLLSINRKKAIFNFPGISLISSIFVICFVAFSGYKIVSMYYSVVKGERATQRMIKYLAEEIPPNGNLYVNFSDVLMEYTYELPLHFKLLYKRPDIKVEYLDLKKTGSYFAGDTIISFKDDLARYPWIDVKHILPMTEEINKNEFGKNWRILKFD